MIILIIELYPPFDQDIFNQDFPNSMEFVFLSEKHHKIIPIVELFPPFNQDIFNQDFPSE